MANRPTRLPMPISPTSPTARAMSMPRSRAAAEIWANGMNMLGAASAMLRYSHQKRRSCSASRRLRPGMRQPTAVEAACARRNNPVAHQPSTSTPSASSRMASRHCSQPMAAAASNGTATVPAPMPALASPAAKPRRCVNQGCTQAIAGV